MMFWATNSGPYRLVTCCIFVWKLDITVNAGMVKRCAGQTTYGCAVGVHFLSVTSV